METFFPSDSGRDVLILLVEDERMSRKALGRLLADQGYTIETVGTAEEAVAIVSVGQRPAVALVDLDLPGMSGAQLLEYLNQMAPETKTVLVTAACEERVANLTDHAAVPYIRKPIDFKRLLRAIDESAATN
jgi:CheY-like chemotaxis protein